MFTSTYLLFTWSILQFAQLKIKSCLRMAYAKTCIELWHGGDGGAGGLARRKDTVDAHLLLAGSGYRNDQKWRSFGCARVGWADSGVIDEAQVPRLRLLTRLLLRAVRRRRRVGQVGAVTAGARQRTLDFGHVLVRVRLWLRRGARAGACTSWRRLRLGSGWRRGRAARRIGGRRHLRRRRGRQRTREASQTLHLAGRHHVDHLRRKHAIHLYAEYPTISTYYNLSTVL